MLINLKKHIENFRKELKKSHPAYVLFLEILVGLILTLSSLLVFFKIRSEVLDQALAPFDAFISYLLYSLRNPFLTKIMIFISHLGGRGIIFFGLVTAIFLTARKHRRETFLFGFILTMAVVLNIFLKDLTQRPRPQFLPLVDLQGYSFPSGHAMNSFVFYTTLSYFIYHFTKSKKAAVFGALASSTLIFMIGVSRVYLGAHFPTDVIAGYFGGLAWFATVLLLEKTFIFYRIFKENKEQ